MSLVSKPMLESLNGKQFVAGILLDRSKDALAEQSKLLSPAVVLKGNATITSRMKQLLPPMPPLKYSSVITVFLDHNGVSWHAEV